MALRFGFPKTDNLLCSQIVCREKATVIVHMKDGTEQFCCVEHFPTDMVGKSGVVKAEKLRQPGERNAPKKPAPGDA